MRDDLQRLEAWFGDCPAAAVAFSGGVDSSLTTFLARRFLGRERAKAYIAASPSLKLRDLDEARRFCDRHDIRLEVLRTRELDDERYAANPSNRCYFCKSLLYDEIASHLGDSADSWVLNGTNLDDTGDHRPGLLAAGERSVRSPLVECGIDKVAVRALAARFELECAAKPASPCMSSRIPYGQRVTLEKLRQIEAGEALVHGAGFPVARLRHYGERAVIEVPSDRLDDLREALPGLETGLRELGFDQVVVDGEGFVSGKLNRALASSGPFSS